MVSPTVMRITRLVSRPHQGAELADRCAAIAEREARLHPAAFVVHQGRRLLQGGRTEVVSVTTWSDLRVVREHLPAGSPESPPFLDEYADLIESWSVEMFEVTRTPENGVSV